MVFHNASYDIPVLKAHGLTVVRYLDTIIMSRQLALQPGNGLKECARHHLQISISTNEHEDWSHRPLGEEQIHYAALDGEATLRLHDFFEPMIWNQWPCTGEEKATQVEKDLLHQIRSILHPICHGSRIYMKVQKKQCKIIRLPVEKTILTAKGKGFPLSITIGSQKFVLQNLEMESYRDALIEQL